MTKRKKESEKLKTGRPTKLTELTVKKLEEAFAIGCNDTEACAYAEITRQTLFNYFEVSPSFLDKRNALKERPILKAKKTIYDDLSEPQTAKWYLERKAREEFGNSLSIDKYKKFEDGDDMFKIMLTHDEPKQIEDDNSETQPE